MADVARHAGVSLKTVSRVVNQEPHVSAAVQRRVLDAINTLGFRRNEAASRLARGASMLTIGLIMENIGNEYYSRLAKAVETAAARREQPEERQGQHGADDDHRLEADAAGVQHLCEQSLDGEEHRGAGREQHAKVPAAAGRGLRRPGHGGSGAHA